MHTLGHTYENLPRYPCSSHAVPPTLIHTLFETAIGHSFPYYHASEKDIGLLILHVTTSNLIGFNNNKPVESTKFPYG